MITIVLFALSMFLWLYGAGPFLLFANAVAHSETNCLISWAKKDGKSTFKLHVYQVLHCIGYLVWLAGFIAIPVLFKVI